MVEIVLVAIEELEVVAGVGGIVVNTDVASGFIGGKVKAVVAFVEEVLTKSVKLVVLDSVEVGV